MLDTIKQKLPGRTVKRKSHGQKGQSLVEMAMAMPLLLLLFIGVFEVGWAIRGYIVLVNVNREATRFAIKNGVLDFSVKDPATVGYDTVLSHTVSSLASQLPLEFLGTNPNTTLILSHIVVDTGFPCVKYQGGKPKVPYEFDANNCDCTSNDPNDSQWFTRDDLVLHPGVSGYSYYSRTFGISQTTRIGGGNYQVEADKMALENNQLNCTILKTGSAGELTVNNAFIAEAFYKQPQLLGVPIVSNRVTDPIPLYAHTAMRIVTSRETEASDTVGPTCEVYPITFDDGIFPDPDSPVPGQSIDAFEGGGTGNFGWMNWDPGDNSNTYIREELYNPRLSMHDFTGLTPPPGLNPDPANDGINIGDWISGKTGVGNSNEVMDELENLVGKTIRVPIYDDNAGPGQNKGYHVSHFALITINQVCLPRVGSSCYTPGSKSIQATFVGYDDDACSG